MGRRPDWEQVRRQAQQVAAAAGEVVTLRSYVSAGAGAGPFGASPVHYFAETLVTALFAANRVSQGPPIPYERYRAGGVGQAATLMVTLERPLRGRDELIWRGTAYRIAGESVPENLGGRVLWRAPLELANATG